MPGNISIYRQSCLQQDFFYAFAHPASDMCRSFYPPLILVVTILYIAA